MGMPGAVSVNDLRCLSLGVIPLVPDGLFVASLGLLVVSFRVPVFLLFGRILRGGRRFRFGVLPFGLGSAPSVFAWVVAPLVARLLLRGFLLFPSLGDWLLRVPSTASAVVGMVCRCLVVRGFLL